METFLATVGVSLISLGLNELIHGESDRIKQEDKELKKLLREKT